MRPLSSYRSFGASQPRLNDLMRGKIDKFSLDVLVNMLAHPGMRVELKVKKAGVGQPVPERAFD